jgi:hypothetical protein
MLALVLVVFSLATMTHVGNSGLAAVSGVTLVDQYGGEDSLASHRGRTVVVMVVTAKRLRNIRPWERNLREHFGDAIDYVRITDVGEDSAASVERISSKLAERVPEGVSVLIDTKRVWATALDLDTSRPNVLVIDGGGNLRSSHHGRFSPELAAPVIEDLKEIVSR